MDGRLRVAVNGDEPERRSTFVHQAGERPARNGLGTVHHVAMAIAPRDEQLRLVTIGQMGRTGLRGDGSTVLHVDLFPRAPEGVLFEVADDAPGFAIDERWPTSAKRSTSARREANRAAIEASLPADSIVGR